MPPTENDPPADGTSVPRGHDFTKEAAVLAKAKEVARKIVERVKRALSDTGIPASLPTEEQNR